MLTPRLTNCVNCTDIATLLDEIDCTISVMAKKLYANTIFMPGIVANLPPTPSENCKSTLLLASLDFSELSEGDPVVLAIHGFLGADQRVQVENPAMAKRQFQFDAVFQNILKIADPQNFTEAIHDAQIGLQIKILQTRALLGCQREG